MMLKTVVYTLLALIAFAANSVLCRMALGDHVIDASSFTVLRLLSGIIVLMLFIYAAAFSFAYISLDTTTGALVLFAAVQLTMIIMHVLSGNRLHISEWCGLLLAFFGFLFLILPGLNSPSLSDFILMLAIVSGALASGIGYTLWYSALAGLSVTEASVVQLSVPILAAMGGVLFVSELITLRLIISGLMILGGILVVVLARHYFTASKLQGDP